MANGGNLGKSMASSGPSGIFGLLAKRLDWLSQRQGVLSQNVANADTPNFVPKDLAKGSFEAALRQSAGRVSVTNSAHLAGSPAAKGGFKADEQREFYETAPSGNAVIIEEQLIKLTDTQINHAVVTNLYRKYAGMVRTALGAGGGGQR